MNDQETQNDNPDNDSTQSTVSDKNIYSNIGYLVRWVGISLIVIGGLIYLAYHLGSNKNQHEINELNQEIERLGEMESLTELVAQFETIGQNLKLSGNERIRLTELLDQMILNKSTLQLSEVELQQSKNKILNITENYKNKIVQLQKQNVILKDRLAKAESARPYTQGTLKRFELNLNGSYSLLAQPASNISLYRILKNDSAQVYVGDALMFFHVGHTLRFRFLPNWLCNITLTKVNNQAEDVQFEYMCEES